MMRVLADENVHADIVRLLRKKNFDVLYVPEIRLAGENDHKILEYADKNDLILITGDKDFGGLIEFGTLWGRGRVILFRHRIINPKKIAVDIVEVLNNESKIFQVEKSFVIVISETRYRIHIPQ